MRPQNSPHYVYADFHVADSLVYESQTCVALPLYLSQLKAELLVAVLRVFGNTMYTETNDRDLHRLLLLNLKADMVYLLGREEIRPIWVTDTCEDSDLLASELEQLVHNALLEAC